MFVEIFVFLTAVVMYLILRSNSKSNKLLDDFPGPKSYPIVGNILEFVKGGNVPAVIKRLSQQHGPVFRMWFWSQPVVVIRDPADIEDVFSHGEAIIEQSVFYNSFDPLIGRGLYLCPASRWKSERKLINPIFHVKVIESFVPAIEKNTRKLAKRFLEQKGDFKVEEFVTYWQFENLVENLFGLDPDDLKEGEKYIEAIHKFAEIFMDTDFGIYAVLKRLFQYTSLGRKRDTYVEFVKNYAEKILKEKKFLRLKANSSGATSEAQKDDDESKYKPLLDALLDMQAAGADVDDEYICHQIATFVTAGLDTTASAMIYLLYNLSQNPDVQDSVYEEVQKIVEGTDRDLTYQDTYEMRYLDRVIKESTRMYTNVLMSRNCTQDIQMKAGFTIPKNSIVVTFMEPMHKGSHYKNPEKFDPDRFNTNENMPYLAFGAGIRHCVGKRHAVGLLKTGIATMLRHVQLLPSSVPLDLRYFNVMRSMTGVNIKVAPRKPR